MRMRWTAKMAAPFFCAALAACGGSDGMNDERRAQQPQSTDPAQPGLHQTVALSGCLETQGPDGYVLRDVTLPTDDRQQATAERVPGITAGAWVRLDGREQAEALRGHVGQMVALTGTVIDTGANTVGAEGTSGYTVPSGDKSKAASDADVEDKIEAEAGRIARESRANGTAAAIRVTSVEPRGERCATGQEPEVR
jgi:hypothetical protein